MVWGTPARRQPRPDGPRSQINSQIETHGPNPPAMRETKKVENPGFDPGASSLRTTHSTD